MFEPKKIGEEGWSPFSVAHKQVTSDRRADPNAAREVSPIQMRTNFRFTDTQSAEPAEDEAEASAEMDPKASSVISSVEASGNDSSMSSSPQILTPESIHPSSLPLAPEDPVSVEKDTNPTDPKENLLVSPLIPVTSLGLKKPDAGVQP